MSSQDKKTSGLTRAEFLKGSALVALGAAAPQTAAAAPAAAPLPPGCKTWSWEASPAPIPAAEIKKTVDTDVLVIGAGLSGFCAAIAAKEAGADAIIIDKNRTYAARGGHITGFGTKVHDEMGIKVNYRQIIRSWVLWAQGRVKEELLWEFAHKSGACLNWVMDMVQPKGLKVALWDGYYKGPDYTEQAVTHFFYKEGTDFIYKDGIVAGAGNPVLLPALEEVAKERGIQIHYRTKAMQFVRDGTSGPIRAVIAGEKGNYTRYNARKGVIIATGDYASNTELKQRFDPFALQADAQIYFPNKCNTGDAHIMAMQIGGAMQKVEPHAAVIHLEAGAASYGFLHVNALGKRYKNEDVNTQSKSCTKAFEPGNIAWTIYDADGLAQVKAQVDGGLGGGLFYGQTFQRKGVGFDLAAEQQILERDVKVGKVKKADTLEELAKQMGVPAAGFLATVKRYNDIVAMKDDVDFGKRAELLTPIVKPPFYAGKLLSTLLTMSGGLSTNTRCEVLDPDGKPVGNLFVVGAAAGDFFANDYPTICPGIGHGRCITFGRLAGIIAAGKSIDSVPSLKI